jgi:hypothetical protein
MKIDGDTTPLVPFTSWILLPNPFIIRTEYVQNPATYMAVERANQYIFLKQLRFIIYMRLGDTVYKPWVETLLSTLAAPQNLYFVELTC